MFSRWGRGLWRFQVPAAGRFSVIAGVTERSCALDELRTRLPAARAVAQAEQVHGASVASIGPTSSASIIIPGCDGLATTVPGVLIVIRSADCLPILAWDPIRRAAAIIHAGWRGVAASLPARLIVFMQQMYASRPQDLWVGIGPAIRACCYEVGPEFERRFGAFVRSANGRRTCDLVGCARAQLREAGVRMASVHDCGRCTACDTALWYSYRREGEMGGRLLSFMVIAP